MSKLTAAARLIANSEVRSKTTAAIRKTAAGRTGWEAAPGALARVALLDPSICLEHMLVRISVNPAIADAACPSCGHAWHTIDDGDVDAAISYVVEQSWGAVAEAIYPAPATPAAEA